jgi:predicted membrane protein
MDAYKGKKTALRVVPVMAAIVVLFVMTGWSIRYLDGYLSPMGTVIVVLCLVSLFVAGTMWLGCLTRRSRYHYLYSGTNNGAVFALLLTAFGVLLLGFNTGVLPVAWRSFFFSWPMILYVAGVIGICRSHYPAGSIVALIGAFFLIAKTSAVYPDEWRFDRFCGTYWPVLIILPGLVFFAHACFTKGGYGGHFKHRHWRTGKWEHVNWWEHKNRKECEDGKINYQSLFGGIEQVVLDPVFHGGVLETTFGGIELDLSHTSLPEGDTYLYVKTVFGGIQITVPPEWSVEIVPAKTVAGGVNDQRVRMTPPAGAEKNLVLVAECVFGGVVLK